MRASNVFTTHTPVPAGNDHFHPDLVRTYLTRKADEMGIGIDRLLALGRQDPANNSETFCMTVLALRLSRFANGVSELHGHVSREMWQQRVAGGARGRDPHRPRDQRHPHPQLAVLGDRAAVRPLPGAPLVRGADEQDALGPGGP